MLSNPLLRSQLKYDPESKKIKVIDKSGEELTDSDGNAYDVNSWVEKVVKPSRPHLFAREISSGTGSQASVNNGNSKQSQKLSMEEFLKLGQH
jgi:hypothetical protein